MSSVFRVPGLACDGYVESCALEEAGYLADEDVCQALTLLGVYQ